MGKRLDDLEGQQRTLKSRIGNIERLQREAKFTLQDISHKITIILGHTTVTSEETSDFKLAVNERFDRLDDRVTEAHKELAEQFLLIRKQDKKMDEVLEVQKQILTLLQNTSKNQP